MEPAGKGCECMEECATCGDPIDRRTWPIVDFVDAGDERQVVYFCNEECAHRYRNAWEVQSPNAGPP